MRPSAIAVAFLCVALACAQDAPTVEELIKQLSSSDFRKREAATKSLLERPEAEGSLRTAMHSKDLEFSRRVAAIVEKLEWRRSPLRELDNAIREGHVVRAIELIAAWPEEKFDHSLWTRVEELYSGILNEKDKGLRGRTALIRPKRTAKLVRYTEADSPVDRGHYVDLFQTRLLRVNEADFDQSRFKGDPKGQFMPLMFSAGKVCLKAQIFSRLVLFAAGDVQIRGGSLSGCVVVSGGDVIIEGQADGCLIISKGSIDALKSGGDNNQIISRKNVAYKKSSFLEIDWPQITENEANPLGYIRWSEPPKEKAVPKAQ